MTTARSFDGTLLEVPFGSEAVRSAAVEQYTDLLATHDSEDILVVTGSPTSMATVEDVLGEASPGATVPRVTSLIVHATEIINRTDDRAILSDSMRRELIHRFLDNYDWDSPYFQRAATQESFAADIAQLLETATWQDSDFDTTPELQELAVVRDDFHAWLDEHGHVERGQMLSQALATLRDGDESDELRDFTAILVVEFEEFVALDRRYLQALAADRELICLAETDASIRRTWTESGAITDHVTFDTHGHVDASAPATQPAATAQYFAQGTASAAPEQGDVKVLTAETPDAELRQIADEIERLRDDHDLAYDDIAVGYKHSGESVIDAMDAFADAGIPTVSATIVGFGDDPAVRELLTVVQALATDGDEADETDTAPPESDMLTHTSEDLLSEDLRDRLAAMDQLGEACRLWASESGLKERIATTADPLAARTQFGNVRRAFAMAEFLDETGFLDATWETFAGMLTRAHEYAPQHNQTSAIEREGGVRVDHLRALKNGSFRVVFLPELIDEVYPGQPMLSRLFPQERVMRMPDYPGISQVDTADVAATFPTESTASGQPVRQYHAEHARRHLAVGASIASERLYLCLHTHADTALDERVQPSRFLVDAYWDLPWVQAAEEPAIATERAAEEFLLSRVDRALADVRRAHSQDVTVSLDEVEADLAEIDALLADSGDRGERLRDALQARVDFAAGRVRRD